MKSSASRKLAFICYATPDIEEVEHIVGWLERSGITCWMAPRDVRPGSNYAESIVDAIQSAELLIVLLSSHANASPHVANEIERAVHYRKSIVPVRIAEVEPSRSIELHLSTRQWVEMWGTPEIRQRGVERLVESLQEVLKSHLPAAVQAPDKYPGASVQVGPRDEPVEAGHTELEVIGHDGTSTLLTDPSIAYPGGFGPSRKTTGLVVRRGIEELTLLWARVRILRFHSRQVKNERGTTVWRHDVEVTLANGKVVDVELVNDWNMAYMGGGGTGLLFGQSDLGETSIPFSSISVLKVITFAR